jgi:ABC-type nitrate/sulfonate/bicarbonate transport system ATPase subunit
MASPQEKTISRPRVRTGLLDASGWSQRSGVGRLGCARHLAQGGPGAGTAGLIHQRELLFGFMTVAEHIRFHAVARMSKKHSKAEIEQRIQTVGT